jgi:hypothetical protein
MRRFIGQGLLYTVATVLVLLSVNGPVAEARHHKPPKDAPGLELPILTAVSMLGYTGYYYLNSRKR